MKTTEKLGLDGRVGDRFEPMPITPRKMVEVLDSDESKINGLAIDGTTYKPTTRFYKTLAAELGIPYGVFGFFSPHEVMVRAADEHLVNVLPKLRDALWSSFSSTAKGDARRHLSQSVG